MITAQSQFTKKATYSALVKVVANDTTLLYAGKAFTLDEVLSASPLHLFCSQHVASHFS